MFKRMLAAAVVGLVTLLATALPASAIKYGDPDGGEHPYVGFLISYRWIDFNQDGVDELLAYGSCSGTQMARDTFLTAGHCVDGADAVAIWYGDDLRQLPLGDLAFFDIAKNIADAYSYRVETHPEYDPTDFTLHDVGLVREMTFKEGVEILSYGNLPARDYGDGQSYWDRQLALNKKNRDSFTIVGYGLQWSMPSRGNSNPSNSNARQSEGELIKLQAHADLLGNRQYGGGKDNDSYVVLSNNAKNGGICFGDSGGPTLIKATEGSDEKYRDTVVAVISFVAKNPTCSGPGGVYRIDTANDLAWLSSKIM